MKTSDTIIAVFDNVVECYNRFAMNIYSAVQDFINRKDLLDPHDEVLAGVSGGPDSLALLDILSTLGYRVTVAHLDHSLRPESSADAEFVRKISESAGCNYIGQTLEQGQLDLEGLTLEEAARKQRYTFLTRSAKELGIKVIAVGHTADDQVETILMHLLRGAGPMGLRGMLSKRSMDQWCPGRNMEQGDISLIRPLLELSREDTIRHCRDVGWEPRWDESNLDQTYFRNRLRHELLPLLETYNTGVRRHLLQTSLLLEEQSDFIDKEVRRQREFVIRDCGDRCAAVSRRRFMALHDAIQRASLFIEIQELVPHERNISFSHIERTLEGIRSGRPSRIPVIGDLELVQSGEEAIICPVGAIPTYPQYPQLIRESTEVGLDIHDGFIRLKYGWWMIFQEQLIETPEDAANMLKNLNHRFAAFDVRHVERPLRLHWRNPGDRLVFDHKGRSKKISDVMMAAGIPERARIHWPVLSDGYGILWVPGIRRSSRAMVKEIPAKVITAGLFHSLSDFIEPAESGMPYWDGCIDKDNSSMHDRSRQVDLLRAVARHGNLSAAALSLDIHPGAVLEPLMSWQKEHGVKLLVDTVQAGNHQHVLAAEAVQILDGFLKYSI